jgi:hypothetical protein
MGSVVQTEGSNDQVFYDPVAPIYMTQGTAGALQRERWIEPKPVWSVKRYQKYGYGRI